MYTNICSLAAGRVAQENRLLRIQVQMGEIAPDPARKALANLRVCAVSALAFFAGQQVISSGRGVIFFRTLVATGAEIR